MPVPEILATPKSSKPVETIIVLVMEFLDVLEYRASLAPDHQSPFLNQQIESLGCYLNLFGSSADCSFVASGGQVESDDGE